MKQGYYVIQPDAEGPHSTWLVGAMEENAVLDAIRATANFQKLDITTTQAALYGYSGGAHSTIWAAGLGESYAPDVNIIAAAYGGTPVDLISGFKTLNGGPMAVLAGAALFGLAQGYPTLEDNFQNGDDGLTDDGKTVTQKLRARGFCPISGSAEYAGTDFNTLFKTPLLENKVLIDIFEGESSS